tara:strand:- start:265 stop:483 length:219 start_codon:yes stop_codon:yes gene_type:complete
MKNPEYIKGIKAALRELQMANCHIVLWTKLAHRNDQINEQEIRNWFEHINNIKRSPKVDNWQEIFNLSYLPN